MGVDGTGLHEVARGPGPCLAAIYLSTIYSLDADEPAYHIAFCALAGDGEPEQNVGARARQASVPELFICRLADGQTRQITFDPGGAMDPCLLSDGRLLFLRGTPPAGPPKAQPDLTWFTVNPDGTDLSLFTEWRGAAFSSSRPCEIADGRVVFAESMPSGPGCGGRLVGVERARSLRSGAVLADGEGGDYFSPSPLPDGRLLVSFRSANDTYGIQILDPATGVRVARVVDSPEWHTMNAQVLFPRREPHGYSSIVDDRRTTSQFYCLNTYLSDTEQGEQITQGQIKRVRIMRAGVLGESGDIATSPGAGEAGNDVLGEAPVERDGSFFVEVPPQTPLRFEILDSNGGVLRSMRSWVWGMPRECRGCIGCHEDRELSPPNRFPWALRRGPLPLGVSPPAPGTPLQDDSSSSSPDGETVTEAGIPAARAVEPALRDLDEQGRLSSMIGRSE